MPTCANCGQEVTAPDRIAVWGMFDDHLFERIPGHSVRSIVENWRWFNANGPHPARVGGSEVDDLGSLMLCPAILLRGKQEVRRVGTMVFPGSDREQEQLDRWIEAMRADPAVSRLLESREVDVHDWWERTVV